MTNISLPIVKFLEKNNLQGAERKALAGDASNRRYERIQHLGNSYMLMIAPPEKEDVRPFVKVGKILVNQGLNAPKILAEDIENGYLLLEDFGDVLYSKYLANNPSSELALYKAAIEVLEHLPTNSDLPDYSMQKLLDETALLTDWYKGAENRDEYLQIWSDILSQVETRKKVLVMRDYHADNLMWLPEREGLQKVGLLDFQDALMGHAAYDLVSLLEDARRDVTPETVKEILKNYDENFIRDYYILGAQRNCKIIGIFNRLKKRDGKDNYLKFIPRVAAHLAGDLQHPSLKPMRDWIERNGIL